MKRIAVFLCLVGFCRAQPSLPMIEGELVADQAINFTQFTVRLEDKKHQEMPVSATVNLHGEFRLNGVPNGLYDLRVLDERGNEIVSEPMSISPSSHNITIRMPPAGEAPPRGPVSLARLSHKPDPRAMQAAVKAQKFAAGGDRDDALAELSRAVAIDPKFADAWNNLGVEYIRAGRFDDAIAALEAATNVDTGCARCYSNLAMALCRTHRLDDAEVAARRGVQLDASVPASHYVLGGILAAKGAREEAIHQLELAGSDMPAARKLLAALRPSE